VLPRVTDARSSREGAPCARFAYLVAGTSTSVELVVPFNNTMAARILLVLDVTEQKPSAVTEAIAKLGSVRRVAMAADVPAETVYLARARGRFLQAGPVLRLAEALHPDDPVRQFAAAKKLAGID